MKFNHRLVRAREVHKGTAWINDPCEDICVGDPELNSNTGIDMFGQQSKYIYDDVIDMDFSAMYPHIAVSFNIERNTMIGKLFIDGFEEERYDHIYVNNTIYNNSDDEDETDDENIEEPEVLKKYDAGRDFIDNYLTGDVLTLGTKWFNLPGYDKIIEEFKKEYKIKPRRKISITTIIGYFVDRIKVG